MPMTTDIDHALFSAVLALLKESTEDYFFLWDTQKDIYQISPAALERYELPGSIVKNFSPLWLALVHPGDRKSFLADIRSITEGQKDNHDMVYRVRSRSGEYRWIRCRGKHVSDKHGKTRMLVGMISDIHEQLVDASTGLPCIARMRHDFRTLEQLPITFGICGIDNIKYVNEKYGWSVGDTLLRGTAEVLQRHLPDAVGIYRLDGDKFGLLHPLPEQGIKPLFRHVQEEFTQLAHLTGHAALCTLSAGLALYPKHGEDFDKLYRYADSALNFAKRSGKNRISIFSSQYYAKHMKCISLQEALLHSVEHNFEGFEVVYQPQVRSSDASLLGAEALLRWESKEYGAATPTEFIPVLEETGLILPVGRWILDRAMQQYQQWQRHCPDFCISVNVSYVQLEKEDLASFVLERQKHYGMPPGTLVLELTESKQLQNYTYYNKIFEDLHTHGVLIAIDDFGTGYSNLSYLKNLKVDIIKVDRCFVRGIPTSSSDYDYHFLRSIIDLAHHVGLKIYQEGVETLEELQVICPLVPDVIQGYLYGRPLPPLKFEENFLKLSPLQPQLENSGPLSHAE